MKNKYMPVLVCGLLLCMSACVRQAESTVTAQVPETTQVTEPVLPVAVIETQAAEPTEIAQTVVLPAEEIPDGTATLDGADLWGPVTDHDYQTKAFVKPEQSLVLESERKIGGVYLQWDTHPGEYCLIWEGGSLICGVEGFQHEYVTLPEPAKRVELVLTRETAICELALYTEGETGDQVQRWLPPCEQADVLVFPTHSDDDTLFFGALIAQCAIGRELTVQTAFMVDHYYEPVRSHERLNGLWEMGIRHYPILGKARDYYPQSVVAAENYHREDDIMGWQVEQLRRFRPLVAVGHDWNGEYGHPQHILNARYLTQAVELAAREDQYPQSVQSYGVWDTPKLYLHLYGEEPLILDVNTPLENDSENRTAFQVAEDAYSHHKSQHQYHYQVLQGEEHPQEDCTRFCLFRSTVGADTDADLMENTEQVRTQ